MKLVRIVIYEGSETDLRDHLTRATTEGVHSFADIRMRVIQLPNLVRGFKAIWFIAKLIWKGVN